MDLKEVGHIEFSNVFSKPNHVFNSARFNYLNRNKTDEIKFLLFINKGKPLMGIIGGIKNKKFSSPFSAPFGGWCYNYPIDMQDIERMYDLFEVWVAKNKIEEIKMIFPPFFYNETLTALFFNVSVRKGYSLHVPDLNFHFDLKNFNSEYINNIAYNARKNFRIAERNNLFFNKVIDLPSIRLAYDIISINRQQRGFPLKMTLENIEETIKLIEADFFIVQTSNQISIASAIVFRITPHIAQVIYWGHDTEHSNLKPINFISYELFKYYKEIGFKYVDIGPSTEEGIPNYGLVDFKQSIGCEISSKLTLVKKLV